jgi:hypothetical protein
VAEQEPNLPFSFSVSLWVTYPLCASSPSKETVELDEPAVTKRHTKMLSA